MKVGKFSVNVSVKTFTRIINHETSKTDVYCVHKINLLKRQVIKRNFPNLLIILHYTRPIFYLPFRPILLFLPDRASKIER